MRAAGKLAAQVLEYAGTLVKPGTTTDEIDKAVHEMIIKNGAVSEGLQLTRLIKGLMPLGASS